MPHLVCDDIIECPVLLHLLEVRRVELHFAFSRKESSGPGVRWTKSRRACLSQDTAGAINVGALRQNKNVVNYFTVNQNTRQVPDNHTAPAISRGFECFLLVLGQSSKKSHFDGEGGFLVCYS